VAALSISARLISFWATGILPTEDVAPIVDGSGSLRHPNGQLRSEDLVRRNAAVEGPFSASVREGVQERDCAVELLLCSQLDRRSGTRPCPIFRAQGGHVLPARLEERLREMPRRGFASSFRSPFRSPRSLNEVPIQVL
jgi:hypothetical protein